jgi:hypothetical protein
MDIAKYIGLYLQNNRYCCLQGLGNIEIKRIPAKRNGEQLEAPTYTATLQQVGSIDDAFPNFVANIEHISIAKASNEISDFIKKAKATLAEGGEVSIPGIGTYTLVNHKLNFNLDPAFKFQENNLHFPKIELKQDDASLNNDPLFGDYSANEDNSNKSSFNWNLIAFWGIVLLIVGGVAYWAISYFSDKQDQITEVIEAPKPAIEPSVNAPIVQIDSNTIDTTIQNNTPTVTGDSIVLKFLIHTYNTFDKADKRAKKLTSFGYQNLSVFTIDSTTHQVISTLKIHPNDSTRFKDSLSKNLNPSGGVTIIK